MAGLFIALYVDKCTGCQSHWKFFGWHRFQEYSLALAWGVKKRVEKSPAILEHLMTFRSSISTGKPEQLLSLMCFSSISWSRAYGLCGLSLYMSNDLTYNSIRFKKPLDIFWPHIQRKGSEGYLVMILAINRKFWAIFLPRVHRANTGKPAWNINKFMLTWLMIFRDTLFSILLFMNENYCLCTCFTELYLFYWLLVVPLAIFIAEPVVSSRT